MLNFLTPGKIKIEDTSASIPHVDYTRPGKTNGTGLSKKGEAGGGELGVEDQNHLNPSTLDLSRCKGRRLV